VAVPPETTSPHPSPNQLLQVLWARICPQSCATLHSPGVSNMGPSDRFQGRPTNKHGGLQQYGKGSRQTKVQRGPKTWDGRGTGTRPTAGSVRPASSTGTWPPRPHLPSPDLPRWVNYYPFHRRGTGSGFGPKNSGFRLQALNHLKVLPP
jgi:hypothetical protein